METGNLCIITTSGKKFTVNQKTGVINGFERWVFTHLYHRKTKKVVLLGDLSAWRLEKLGLNNHIFLDNECPWQVCDLDLGTARIWGDNISRIWVEETKDHVVIY